MAVRFDGGASALIVAQPGPWRDALLAMLDEIPRIETIHLARGVVSALRSAAAHCPDLVLLDTDLTGGWASSFPGELKALCPHVRSLVLTHESPDPDQFGTLPADAVVVKGCSAATLFEVLESLLPEGGCDSQRANSNSQKIEEVMRPSSV